MNQHIRRAAAHHLERVTEAHEYWRAEALRTHDQTMLDVVGQLQHEITYWRSITTGERTPALWLADDGHLACELHLGHYAQTELQQRPNARHLVTPLDSWHRMEPYDIEELERLGAAIECVTCRDSSPGDRR